MKILFFIESLGHGGKERRLVELIKGLSKSDTIEMEIVLLKSQIQYEDIFLSKIKIHYIPRKYTKKDPLVFFKFFRIAKKIKPDIINVWGNMVAIYAIPTKIILNIPMINNQITDAPSKFKKSILDHKITFPFSNKIVSNSKAGLVAYKAPINKSIVIYNGFDFDRIKNTQSEKITRSKFKITTRFVVGMAATFSNFKDYPTYIKAAGYVLNKRNDVTFLCIGPGDDNKIREMVSEKNKENILFLGNQKDVESIMKICNIGVLTTFTEGVSNSLLEFMSLKKPIIATGGGGCGEVIENNINGFLFPQGDYLGLANSINDLLNDENKMKDFGEESYNLVIDRFGIDRMINEFKELYINFNNKS